MTKFYKTVIVDTCFWFALYTTRDTNHKKAVDQLSIFETTNILIPWPTLYETINTEFIKNNIVLQQFEEMLQRDNVIQLSDEPYRDSALETCIRMSIIKKRKIALVDMVIRLIVEDVNVRKHGLLTFNIRDFIDVCTKNRVEIW